MKNETLFFEMTPNAWTLYEISSVCCGNAMKQKIWRIYITIRYRLQVRIWTNAISRCRFGGVWLDGEDESCHCMIYYHTGVQIKRWYCKIYHIHELHIRGRSMSCLLWELWCNQSSSAYIMTSSNGNICRVTGHLCGKFTGPRWIPRTKASDAELWCFLWSVSE